MSGRSPRPMLAIVVALACGWAWSCTRPPTAERANVILVVVDTLRADHLGCYGYPQPTTPRIDELAARGTRFAAARAASSWTLPSVASILTGTYPAVHGAERADTALSGDLPTVAEDFRAAGYATAAFSANPAFVTPRQGLSRGFESFEVLRGPAAAPRSVGAVPADASMTMWVKEATAPEVTAAAVHWMEQRRDESPFFLYVHYFDPHASYSPPPEFARRFGVAPEAMLNGDAQWRFLLAPEAPPSSVLSTLRKLYDAEVAFADASIGALVDAIPGPSRERTLVIVTADHGEEFGEHGGMQHGRTLFEELVHVPLVMAGPSVPAGRVVESPVSLASLRATLTTRTGALAEAPPGAEASFAELFDSGSPASSRVYADLDARFPGDSQRHRRAAIDGSWKLLLSPSGDPSLFDLAADAAESRDLAAAQQKIADDLADDIGRRDAEAVPQRAGAPPRRMEIDAGTREKLKALGYLQ